MQGWRTWRQTSCWHCWQTWALNSRQSWLPLPASTRALRGQQIEGSQKAWPFPVAFQVCRSAGPLSTSVLPPGKQQLQPSSRSLSRSPGECQVGNLHLLVSPLCIIDHTSPYDSLSRSHATFDCPVFLSILTDLSPCPARYLGSFAECSMQPCYAPLVLP